MPEPLTRLQALMEAPPLVEPELSTEERILVEELQDFVEGQK